MSSIDFNFSSSFQVLSAQMLKPKMLLSPCSHMVETDEVIKILSSQSLKKECNVCKTEIKEYRTIDMSDFAAKVKTEIDKVQGLVSKQANEAFSKQSSDLNLIIEKLRSEKQEIGSQLSQRDLAAIDLKDEIEKTKSKVAELEGEKQQLNSAMSQKLEEIQKNGSQILELQTNNQKLTSEVSQRQSEIETLKLQLSDMTKKMESLQEKVTSNVPSQESKQEVESQEQAQNQQVEQQVLTTYWPVSLTKELPEGYYLGYRSELDWSKTNVAECMDGQHAFYGFPLNKEFKFVLTKGWNDSDFVEWEQLKGNRSLVDPQYRATFDVFFPSLKK